MRRPIKFRAWDAFRMEMFRVNSLNSYVDRDVDNPLKVVRYHGDSPSQFILMQFTSLTDRNGVEIYEGDVVRFKEYNRLYQVLYKEASFRLIHLSNDSLNGLEWGRLDRMFELIEPPTIEVIGNIYQNPELQEGGNPA